MSGWLKYVVSIASGFGLATLTAKGSGATTANSLILGAVGAITTVSNLQATSPADHKKLGIE